MLIRGGAKPGCPPQPRLRSRLELGWRAGGPISPAARALLARARTALSR